MEEFVCDACGFRSFSKILYQEHSCQGDSSRWLQQRPEAVSVSFVERSEVPPAPVEEPVLPGVVEDEGWDPDHPAFRCICGFTAFSQILFEDHECKYVMREAVKASMSASATARLKDLGLHQPRAIGLSKQGPKTVLVKCEGKVLYGPRPLDKDTTVERLKSRILEVKKQPWATVKLFHKEVLLEDELVLNRVLDPDLVLTAEVLGTTLNLHVKKNVFNKFPDVITEFRASPQSLEVFEAEVKEVQEQLRSSSRFRSVEGNIAFLDSLAVLTALGEQPRSLSCVPLSKCLEEEQHRLLRNFLEKEVRDARMWRYEAYGHYYLLAWVAGHRIRLSVISEDVPTRIAVAKIALG